MEIKRPYTLHITRRDQWFDKKNYNAIPLTEWIAYVKADHQMKLINEIEIPLSQLNVGMENVLYRSKGLSFWKIHVFKGEAVVNTWFEYERGNVDVKDADDETIKKMIAIAGRLGAKVQGDKGEIYDDSYCIATEPKKSWWKFW